MDLREFLKEDSKLQNPYEISRQTKIQRGKWWPVIEGGLKRSLSEGARATVDESAKALK
ncbi:MAG: hypothetical protein WHS46_13335 [Desulfosoma sp.]